MSVMQQIAEHELGKMAMEYWLSLSILINYAYQHPEVWGIVAEAARHGAEALRVATDRVIQSIPQEATP